MCTQCWQRVRAGVVGVAQSTVGGVSFGRAGMAGGPLECKARDFSSVRRGGNREMWPT